jgi:hypothetical protein
VGPHQHGMARPQAADGGDGFHLLRVAVNKLNKQPLTAGKEWSSSLGLTTPHGKNMPVTYVLNDC